VSRIQQGKATAADLAAGGATQLGVAGVDDYARHPKLASERRWRLRTVSKSSPSRAWTVSDRALYVPQGSHRGRAVTGGGSGMKSK
jgi:hypothetical protein